MCVYVFSIFSLKNTQNVHNAIDEDTNTHTLYLFLSLSVCVCLLLGV